MAKTVLSVSLTIVAVVIVASVLLSETNLSYIETNAASYLMAARTGGTPIPFSSVESANITIGDYSGIAIDPSSGTVYVAVGSHLLAIDPYSHSVAANISLPGGTIGGLAIDDVTHTVYVSLSNGVTEVSPSTNAVSGELPVSFLGSIAYDPSNQVLYGYSAAHTSHLIGVEVQSGAILANVSVGPAGWDGAYVVVDPETNMVFTVGCDLFGEVCTSPISVVNATSETLATTVAWNSGVYPSMAIDPATDTVYASGLADLLALNATNGGVLYDVNSKACGILSMTVIPSTNQVAAVPDLQEYLLIYDGGSGNLVNRYSFPFSSPNPPYPSLVAYDPITNELYVANNEGQLLALHNSASIGNVNSALVGSGTNCGIP